MTAYQQLEERFRRIGALEQAISVLHWDTAAMMPEGGTSGPIAWPVPPATCQRGSTAASGDHGEISHAEVSQGDPALAVVGDTAMLMSP